ncbi:hypothetical protein PM082_000001 [Marasmius tenuissimus]|nr:hypothetical protein PM082_000001 [Marasmius tenuissimus]
MPPNPKPPNPKPPCRQPAKCDICNKTIAERADLIKHKWRMHVHPGLRVNERPKRVSQDPPSQKRPLKSISPLSPLYSRCLHSTSNCILCRINRLSLASCSSCFDFTQGRVLYDRPEGCIHPECLLCRIDACPQSDCPTCISFRAQLQAALQHFETHQASAESHSTGANSGAFTQKGAYKKLKSDSHNVGRSTSSSFMSPVVSPDANLNLSYPSKCTPPLTTALRVAIY